LKLLNNNDMKKYTSSSATQGVRVEPSKKRVPNNASQQPNNDPQAQPHTPTRINILVEASRQASIVMHNPVLHEAFWHSYTLSYEHKYGMSFWNFLVKRFTLN
jgi:hypothetical protein